jgi:hypothetical protein
MPADNAVIDLTYDAADALPPPLDPPRLNEKKVMMKVSVYCLYCKQYTQECHFCPRQGGIVDRTTEDPWPEEDHDFD